MSLYASIWPILLPQVSSAVSPRAFRAPVGRFNLGAPLHRMRTHDTRASAHRNADLSLRTRSVTLRLVRSSRGVGSIRDCASFGRHDGARANHRLCHAIEDVEFTLAESVVYESACSLHPARRHAIKINHREMFCVCTRNTVNRAKLADAVRGT
jgi:hypothetical protein